MHLLDLSLESAAANVALDEALLTEAERSASGIEVLRIWEPSSPMVVLGRASRVDEEVNQDACQSRRIPVIRRTSGGNAIVTAPGCLMYALLLSYERRPALRIISHAHRFVLGTLQTALRQFVPDVTAAGTSDLAVEGDRLRKFSGNSLRCCRNYLLYHGTLLYDMPLEWISTLLQTPPRQPDYRGNRPHADFVTNLGCTAGQLREALIDAWQPAEDLTDWPQATTQRLVAEKFGMTSWNLRH